MKKNGFEAFRELLLKVTVPSNTNGNLAVSTRSALGPWATYSIILNFYYYYYLFIYSESITPQILISGVFKSPRRKGTIFNTNRQFLVSLVSFQTILFLLFIPVTVKFIPKFRLRFPKRGTGNLFHS